MLSLVSSPPLISAQTRRARKPAPGRRSRRAGRRRNSRRSPTCRGSPRRDLRAEYLLAGADVDALGRLVQQQQAPARGSSSAPRAPSAHCRRTAPTIFRCGSLGRTSKVGAERGASFTIAPLRMRPARKNLSTSGRNMLSTIGRLSIAARRLPSPGSRAKPSPWPDAASFRGSRNARLPSNDRRAGSARARAIDQIGDLFVARSDQAGEAEDFAAREHDAVELRASCRDIARARANTGAPADCAVATLGAAWPVRGRRSSRRSRP